MLEGLASLPVTFSEYLTTRLLHKGVSMKTFVAQSLKCHLFSFKSQPIIQGKSTCPKQQICTQNHTNSSKKKVVELGKFLCPRFQQTAIHLLPLGDSVLKQERLGWKFRSLDYLLIATFSEGQRKILFFGYFQGTPTSYRIICTRIGKKSLVLNR